MNRIELQNYFLTCQNLAENLIKGAEYAAGMPWGYLIQEAATRVKSASQIMESAIEAARKDAIPEQALLSQAPIHTITVEQVTRCNHCLREAGKPYPRTCQECGLGPCKAVWNTKPKKPCQAGITHPDS